MNIKPFFSKIKTTNKETENKAIVIPFIEDIQKKESIKKSNFLVDFVEYGPCISYEFIKNNCDRLNIDEELFKVYLLILKKHKINPFAYEIEYKNNTFQSENFNLTIKEFNKDKILDMIELDFKEELDFLFEDITNYEAKLNYIYNNYETFYGEKLNVIQDHYTYELEIFSNKYDSFYLLNQIEIFLKQYFENIDEDNFWKAYEKNLLSGYLIAYYNNEINDFYKDFRETDFNNLSSNPYLLILKASHKNALDSAVLSINNFFNSNNLI